MRVASREYKLIVDGSLFANVHSGLSEILDDIGDLGRAVGVMVAEKFSTKDPDERTILFLDTPDCTLRENGLLLVNGSSSRTARPNTRSSAGRKIDI